MLFFASIEVVNCAWKNQVAFGKMCVLRVLPISRFFHRFPLLPRKGERLPEGWYTRNICLWNNGASARLESHWERTSEVAWNVTRNIERVSIFFNPSPCSSTFNPRQLYRRFFSSSLLYRSTYMCIRVSGWREREFWRKSSAKGSTHDRNFLAEQATTPWNGRVKDEKARGLISFFFSVFYLSRSNTRTWWWKIFAPTSLSLLQKGCWWAWRGELGLQRNGSGTRKPRKIITLNAHETNRDAEKYWSPKNSRHR